MKIFVINIDKNKERFAKMQAQLERLHLDIDRFSAIYGASLPIEDKKSALNRFAWWCTQGYAARDGQIGCALSHTRIYQKMIDEDIPMCCILEDDVVFTPAFKDIVHYVEVQIDVSEPQVVLLHCHYSEYVGKKSADCRCEILPVKYERCAEAYVVTKKAAQELLALNYPIKRPCDHWFAFAKKGKIKLFQAFPTTCRQDWSEDYRSDVYVGNCVDIRNFGLLRKAAWKFKRLIGKSLEWILHF